MMITPNSLTRQKQVAQGEKEEELEDQGEEQDIIWTVVWGFHFTGRAGGGVGISPILSL